MFLPSMDVRSSEFLLSTVSHRKFSWFGHVCCHDTLPKYQYIQSSKSWNDNIRNGQASPCRRYSAVQTTNADGQGISVCQSTSTTPGRHGNLFVLCFAKFRKFILTRLLLMTQGLQLTVDTASNSVLTSETHTAPTIH